MMNPNSLIEFQKMTHRLMALGFNEKDAKMVVKAGHKNNILTGLMQMSAKGQLDWEDLIQTVYRVWHPSNKRITKIIKLPVNQFIIKFCEMIK